MPADRHYPDSARSRNLNKSETDNWREATDFEHISAAVSRLKRKVEAAYYDCDDEKASEAHDDLTSAEHRLRMCKRQARRNG